MPRPLPGSDTYSGKALPGEHVGIDDATPRYVSDNIWSTAEQLLLREIIAWWISQQEAGAASLATPIAAHLALPGLRAYWPGSAIDHAGTLYDITGQGRHLAKTAGSPYPYYYNRTATVQLTRHSLTAYARPHEAALSLTGQLTAGVWVRLSGAALPATLIGKMGGPGSYSWAITLHEQTAAQSTWRFYTSDNGTNLYYNQVATTNPTAWRHLVATFDMLTPTLFLDGRRMVEATGTPAALHANAEPLTIATAAFDGAPAPETLDCTIAHAFICATHLPDDFILDLFQATRHLFGA
jgi:hypothetical protein